MKKLPLPLILIARALRGTLFLGAGLVLVQPCAGAPGGFEFTGSLNAARYYHTATLLPNGMVLVAGGVASDNGTALSSAELYDPASGTWSATGNLTNARYLHTATLLPNGMVLAAGGFADAFLTSPLADAELYDPTSGTWSPTGSLGAARGVHTATLLVNGMVLVAGGAGDGFLGDAELYDPVSGTWSATGNLANPRYFHTATLLANGKVLAAGGYDGLTPILSSAELYDSASGTWSATGNLANGRYEHTATLLANGTVLVAGGVASDNGTALSSVELYDPASGTWSATGNLANGRIGHTATLLANGTVLVAGGLDSIGTVLSSAELYDSASGTWSPTGSLGTARYYQTATVLGNGAVLVAGGGVFDGSALTSAELYDAGPPVITSTLSATTTVGIPFSYQFEATGATSLDVDINTLPDGLFFDSSLRAIVGSSTVEGTFQVALSATNASGTTSATLALTVQPLPATGPVIMSITSVTGRTGSPFIFQVSTIGGSSLTQLNATGLPDGLSMEAETGIISGTATADGSFPVTLSATDMGITNQATLEMTFTSDLAVPVIVSPENALLFSGIPFSYTFVAPTSNESDPVTYTAIGELPIGLGLDSTTGVVSGTANFVSGAQPLPRLAGGIISNVQGFACNSSGCGVQSLFLLKPTGAANISTRLSVGTKDNVLIGGFITQGDPPLTPMKLMVRGIGPSLAGTVAGPLANPYLELHSGGTTIAANDNWMDNLAGGSQKVLIENATYPPSLLAPTSPFESAILAVLNPGPYTAVLYGTNNGTGVGLVEVYKLGAASSDTQASAILANISTRGNVQIGDNVMIGGFINQGSVPIQVLVRGIGPSLTSQGVSGALANPVLELHKPDGTIITNDDWMATQKDDIIKTTLAPTNPLESAILVTLPVGDGAYTAIVRGANNTTGVALVEAYFGSPCLVDSCPPP